MGKKLSNQSMYLCLSEFRLSNMLVTEGASIPGPCAYMQVLLPTLPEPIF